MNASPLRVLIVDDSRIFRGEIEQALADCADVKVVGSVWNGEKALELARQSLPDLVTLDLEMPGCGGLETLRRLRELRESRREPLGVLLLSSFTRRGAAVTITGLEEGAFDFITKPDSANPQTNFAELRAQLHEKITAFRSRRHGSSIVGASSVIPDDSRASTKPSTPRDVIPYRAVVIAASTGGPEALTRFLPQLAPRCPVPIFLVQHLPANFAEYFVESLSRRCRSRVVLARAGMVAQPGEVYIAPGGKHLVLQQRDGFIHLALNESPPENGCRPAADVLFRSAATAYVGQVLGVILTGMGTDGAKGAAVLKRAGARIIVQDEATSIVWGMPGTAVAAGVADEVLPIEAIGTAVLNHLGVKQ